ncbi:MAG: helix-turn-helix transcriptional regulator [Polyangiales bacterium]|nr:helix-turn-helix transcriptional regulator [Myxococcales bacterium]
MLELRAREVFRVHPEGGYRAGESWIYFCFDAGLFGYALWGRPTAEDVGALVALMSEELDRPRHVAIADLGGIEFVDPIAFDALARYTIEHADELGAIISRAAVVHPPGMNGAIVTGFFEVAARPFPLTLTASLEEAFTFVERPNGVAEAAALRAARADVACESSLRRTLRTYLIGHLAGADLDDAARATGVSVRTLQRRLSEEGTSFEAELQRARLEVAKRRLLDSSAPITEIAFDVGYKTSQHFAKVFRVLEGCSPTEFRARTK